MPLILAWNWRSVKCIIAILLSGSSLFKGLRRPPSRNFFLCSRMARKASPIGERRARAQPAASAGAPASVLSMARCMVTAIIAEISVFRKRLSQKLEFQWETASICRRKDGGGQFGSGIGCELERLASLEAPSWPRKGSRVRLPRLGRDRGGNCDVQHPLRLR